MAGDIRQIFLSHSVASMGEHAVKLNELLRGAGYSTFICTQMDPGQEFRRSITLNAANCRLMVIFIDENWAKSKECISEFNCAYSCFNKKETPKIVPLVMGGFNWIDPREYPEAHAITANFQCLQRGTEESWDDLFEKVMRKVDTMMSEEVDPNVDSSLFLELVTCEICQEPYREPLLLPCNHTFCRRCLEDWNRSSGDQLTCPKCRIPCPQPISQLKPDFRAIQLLDLIGARNLKRKASTKSPGLSRSPGMLSEKSKKDNENENEAELKEWFTRNKISKDVIERLLANGFDDLDNVLDMNESDLKQLGLKAGHLKKMLKCIEETKKRGGMHGLHTVAKPPSKEAGKKYDSSGLPDPMDNWSFIEELYDDRILSSGTHPSDSLKFWASLTNLQFENIITNIKKQAEVVEGHENMAESNKSKCLQQVAMILSDAGSYEEAERFARSALTFEKSAERKYELKALLVYAWHCRLKRPMLVADTKDTTPYYKLLELCNDVIKNGKLVPQETLCKVLILKGFTCQALIHTDKAAKHTMSQDAESALDQALSLAQKINDKGLEAEALMTRALLNEAKDGESEFTRQMLIDSLKLCTGQYGEFSSLAARIYYNIAIHYEDVEKDFPKAYECFRRAWLVDRQLYGPHHPLTKKSGSVLTKDYRGLARTNNDSLPDDDSGGPNERDRNFEERIAFLQ